VAEDQFNKNWPRLADGTVDWKTVFSDPETGLIQLIEAARKPETLIDCTAMVIQALFTRDGDEDIRAGYTRALAKVATSDLNDLPTIVNGTTTILRGIMKDRIKHAAQWAEHEKQRAAERQHDQRTAERQERLRQGMDETETYFSDVFCNAINQKFQAMWSGVPQQVTGANRLPFAVSSDFARIYESVVRDTFMPSIIANCRYIISEAKRLDFDRQRPYLEQRFEDPATHKELWNIWNVTWQHFTEEKSYPAKPREPKSGIFNSIRRAVKDTMVEADEYTMEDWEHDTQIIDQQNADVREVISRFLSASTLYNPPQAGDLERLKNMFAIRPGNVRKQIAAIRQIAQDKETASRVFESYEKGKDLEWGLIAASYQNPEIFLGQKQMLPYLLRGKKEHELAQSMPYLMREMGHLFG